jgi:hypothetical protein
MLTLAKNMPRLSRVGCLALACSLTGCLNLGGRTTHINENPDTSRRLAWLESRVSALEQSAPRASLAPAPVQPAPELP